MDSYPGTLGGTCSWNFPEEPRSQDVQNRDSNTHLISLAKPAAPIMRFQRGSERFRSPG